VRRFLILDLLLGAVVVAAGLRLHNDWIMFEATHQPAAVQPQRETAPALALPGAVSSAAPADWIEIPSRNPFSFDRTDIAILEPKATPVQRARSRFCLEQFLWEKIAWPWSRQVNQGTGIIGR